MTNNFHLSISNLIFNYKAKNQKLFNHFQLNIEKFEIKSSELVLINGNNGSGKSTFVKILAGIIKHSNGTIQSSRKLKIFYSGLEKQLLPFLSGRENAFLRFISHGYNLKKTYSLIEKSFEISEIGLSYDDPVYSYSTGMRARLNFSINILIDFDILIIDESLSVGDSKFKNKSYGLIENKINKSNGAIIVISHDNLNKINFTKKYFFKNGKIV